MGHNIITGFARGVDEEATLGALEGGGRVVAVLPYLLEKDGKLNPRAIWLLRTAASRGALASAVAENLVKDDSRVRAWLAMRNRIIVRMAVALVVPEARFKLMHWGTRHAVEYALASGRLVVVLEPRAGDGDVVGAFEHFRRRGAAVAKNVEEALDMIRRRCRSTRR
jgi:DNA processing protein